MKTRNRLGILAWGLVLMDVVGVIVGQIFWLRSLDQMPSLFDAVQVLGWGTTLPIVFSILAAMIINKQSDNKVGWLMMLVASVSVNPLAIYFNYYLVVPTKLTPSLLMLVWFVNWSWIPIIFPIFLIPLYFPTGKLPSPRWKWVSQLAIGMWLVFITIALFLESLGPLNESWEPLPNPIGFIPRDFLNGPFLALWGIGLLTIVGGSVASLFFRYRRAHLVERQQIKWLLYAGGIFAVYYGFTFFGLDLEAITTGLQDLLFVLSILTMPVAIAVAILRYRLYDIDLIIRRTVVYAVLTAALGVVYFGTVVILQTIIGRTADEQSPLVIVFSTLLIAALFAPLRRRIQAFIDRRFYRRKYDAAQTLARFAQVARDEVNMDSLSANLVHVVEETMQPEEILLWLKSEQV